MRQSLGRLVALIVVTTLMVMTGPLVAPAAAEEPAPAAGAAQANVFDAVAATDAYLAKLSPEQRARSDAYFEGGYWMKLWSFLYGAGIAILLLATGWSARMRGLAARITTGARRQTWLYWFQYLVVTTVLSLPLSIYDGFVREHAFALSTQTFGAWLGDEAKGLAVTAILGGLALMAFYSMLRRAARTWWLWGAGLATLFLVLGVAIGPVFIAPIFNKYTLLEDSKIKEPILRLARANGIPATNVYVMDASRQSNRVSANVSGFLGTQRITLNDNLLKRCTLPEIEAVMAHEMGHYVLNHVYKMILQFGLLLVVGFAFLRWGFERLAARYGERWKIGGITDIAGLPLLSLLLATFFFVATPVVNTIIRSQEVEADIFGLNAARQPDGFAEVALKLADYRKLSPGPLEEMLLFDHPSGRSRILMAMRWKAEQRP